ncbi:22121_t:CDS:2, partial [Dentiscutata erythropus]
PAYIGTYQLHRCSHHENNQTAQNLLNPIIATLNSTTNHVDYLLKCIQSDERSLTHYLVLKTLLEDSSDSLPTGTLRKVIKVLRDQSIYEDHDESTTIMLELNLRALLAAIYKYSSLAVPIHKFNEELFGELINFAKFHITNSNDAIPKIMKKVGSQQTPSFFAGFDINDLGIHDKKLLRNYNVDFLLTLLRDMIHDMEDDNTTASEVLRRTQKAATLTINSATSKLIQTKLFASSVDETGLIEQLRQIFSFKYPKCSWYPKLKNLIKKKDNLFKLALDNADREIQERELVEELWFHASVEWSIQRQDSNYESKEAYDTTAQNINSFLGNEPLARDKSFWFGILDIAQELAIRSKSFKTLSYIYYLALQSLQRARGNYIRSKAIELLITLATRHSMYISEFKVNFVEFLVGLNNHGPYEREKCQKLFNITIRRFYLYRYMTDDYIKKYYNTVYQSEAGNSFTSNLSAKETVPLDIIANELVCPITNDYNKAFKKLPCRHYLSEIGIKGWAEECKSNNKLFSCCICRAEFQDKEVKDAPLSTLYRDMYNHLDSIGYLFKQETITAFLPPEVIIGVQQNSRTKIKVLGLIKKRSLAYKQAKASLKNEDYVLAIYWLNNILETWPDSYSIRCKRAWALQQVGDLYQAISDLNIAAHLKPSKTNAWNLLASVYIQMGVPKLALRHISQALELDQGNPQFLLMRSTIYKRLHQHEHALRDLDIILFSQSTSSSRLKPLIAMLKFKNSSKLYDQNNYTLAKNDLKTLLNWESDHLEGLKLRGRIHNDTYQYFSAISDFDNLQEFNPKDTEVLYYRALVYVKIGKYEGASGYESALDYWYAAYIVEGQNMGYHHLQIWIYFRLFNYRDAISILSDIIEYYYEEVINGNRFYIDFIVLRGFLYSILEDKEENALNDFQIILEVDSENAEALACRGNLYTRLKNFEMAKEDLNAAIEINLKYGEAVIEVFQYRAYLYYKTGDYENSLKDLDTSDNLCSEMSSMVSSKKNYSRVSHLYRGIIYHKLGKYENALENLDKSIEILQDKMTMIPLVERAFVYYSVSRFEGALMDLKKALIVEPKNVYMSKAMSDGIRLYGIMYRLDPCMKTKLNWLDLRNPDPQMPLSTLKRLKEETSFQDDTNDIFDYDYDIEKNPKALEEFFQQFELLLSKTKKTDSISDDDSDSFDLNCDSDSLDIKYDSNDEPDFTNDNTLKKFDPMNDKDSIEHDLTDDNNNEPNLIDRDNILPVEFLDTAKEVIEDEIMAESGQVYKALNKENEVDRYEESTINEKSSFRLEFTSTPDKFDVLDAARLEKGYLDQKLFDMAMDLFEKDDNHMCKEIYRGLLLIKEKYSQILITRKESANNV